MQEGGRSVQLVTMTEPENKRLTKRSSLGTTQPWWPWLHCPGWPRFCSYAKLHLMLNAVYLTHVLLLAHDTKPPSKAKGQASLHYLQNFLARW